jgi:hypothetical protein
LFQSIFGFHLPIFPFLLSEEARQKTIKIFCNLSNSITKFVSTVFLEKLEVIQLVKKFPAMYGT